MNKFALKIKDSNAVLRFDLVNGSYELTLRKDCQIYTFDKAHLMETIRTNTKRDGSWMNPKINFDADQLEVVKIETEVVVSKMTTVEFSKEANHLPEIKRQIELVSKTKEVA